MAAVTSSKRTCLECLWYYLGIPVDGISTHKPSKCIKLMSFSIIHHTAHKFAFASRRMLLGKNLKAMSLKENPGKRWRGEMTWETPVFSFRSPLCALWKLPDFFVDWYFLTKLKKIVAKIKVTVWLWTKRKIDHDNFPIPTIKGMSNLNHGRCYQ